MFVESLTAHNFRNLAPTALKLGPKAVVVVGQNGQGKTNLLEALYVCATGRSFRNATSEELLLHGAQTGELTARVVRQGVRHDVSVRLTPQRKSVMVDGRSLRQVTKLLELVNVVAFFPDDLRVVKGSPEERRRFLDRAIANHRTEFVDAALAYAKVLKSRNAVLKAPKTPDPILLATYNDELVRHGEVLQRCRTETLLELSPLASQIFTQIMPDVGPLTFALAPGVPQPADASFATAFLKALETGYPKDRARGITSVGPHRADVLMQIGGQDARLFASQGQQRTIVLALKLAEVRYLTQRLGMPPVLLLDDVSSELDTERTRLLFEAISEVGAQVWISTTGAAPLPLPADAQRYSVHQGEVGSVRDDSVNPRNF